MCSDGKPLVSVLIGAYNEEESIARTLQSLLGQSFDNHEIIVIDDGSTDDTAEVVQEFGDDRIRLLQNDRNGGLPSALNRGLRAARGEFIARADADEWSPAYRLQRQVEILQDRQGVQVVSTWFRIVGRDAERITEVKVPPCDGVGVNQMIENPPEIAHGSVMMRKSALETVDGYREAFSLAQDYDLWLRLAERYGSGWLHVVPEVLYERKISADQLVKRSQQRGYADAAKEAAKRRQTGQEENLDDLLEQVSRIESQTPSEVKLKAMYEYLAGAWLLHQGQKYSALSRFLRALVHDPTNPRPWYKITLLPLPKPIQDRVIQRVQQIV